MCPRRLQFGKEVENQLEADDDQNAAAVNSSSYHANQSKEQSAFVKGAPPPSGGYAKTTDTNFAYARNGQAERRV